MLHREILTEEQVSLLPLLRRFSGDFFLVGDTAMALYIGHRRSIDFDLFSLGEFKNISIRKKISKAPSIDEVFVNKAGEFTIVIRGVRITFFQYPFEISHRNWMADFISMPSLLDLAAMKAYALGHRAKWKDYVDLYFLMEKYHGPGPLIKKARQIFGREFNEKLFRSQLAYFRDIDYSEKIIYMKGFEVEDRIIKKGLIDFSLI